MVRYIDVYNNFGKDQPVERQPLFHMNCAEVLLRTANAEYNLGLSERDFKLMTGFGGGFYSGKTCGAFIGALAALSAKYAEERPSTQEKVQQGAKLLVDAFTKEFGAMDCETIKALHRDAVTACNPVKERSFKVLQEVIALLEGQTKDA